jgi:hypothetical protein
MLFWQVWINNGCILEFSVEIVPHIILCYLSIQSFQYLTLRSILSLNNLQNNEVLWKYEVDMFKIMLHFKQFHYSYDNIIVDHGNNNNFKIKTRINFSKNKIIRFVNVEIDLTHYPYN